MPGIGGVSGRSAVVRDKLLDPTACPSLPASHIAVKARRPQRTPVTTKPRNGNSSANSRQVWFGEKKRLIFINRVERPEQSGGIFANVQILTVQSIFGGLPEPGQRRARPRSTGFELEGPDAVNDVRWTSISGTCTSWKATAEVAFGVNYRQTNSPRGLVRFPCSSVFR